MQLNTATITIKHIIVDIVTVTCVAENAYEESWGEKN